MDAEQERNLRAEQVDSMGRLIAGFSHEMKNHFGIIRESNGLIGDLLYMHGRNLDGQVVERLNKAVSSIEDRVKIVARTLHHLSGFAHRSDEPLSSFQPETMLEELCIFLGRFARLSQIQFTVHAEEQVPSVNNDPALLGHVLYRLFMVFLDHLQADDELRIYISKADKGARISFQAISETAAKIDVPKMLNSPLEVLQVDLLVERSEAECHVHLDIPSLDSLHQ